MMRRIRLDKFELVLPQAMRENTIDMWIVAMKQNHPDPLWEDLGGGFIGATGYFVFTDRGDRIEKAVFDIDGIGLEGAGRLRPRESPRGPEGLRRASAIRNGSA